jgi:hypothetical protein
MDVGNTGAGAARSHKHQLDEAFARSRSASIVLTVLAALTGTQLGLLMAAAPPDLVDAAGANEGEAAMLLGSIVYVVLFAVAALVCALFAWIMRSRVAMILGLALVGINWLDYILVLLNGQFTVRGVIANAIVTFFLVRSLQAAFVYHKLKSAGPVDPEVFS